MRVEPPSHPGAAGVHDPGTEPGPRPLEVGRRRAQRRAMAGGRLQLRLEVEVVERRDLGRDGAVVPGEEAGDHAERPVGRQRDAHQVGRRSQPGHLVRPPAELGDLRLADARGAQRRPRRPVRDRPQRVRLRDHPPPAAGEREVDRVLGGGLRRAQRGRDRPAVRGDDPA